MTGDLQEAYFDVLRQDLSVAEKRAQTRVTITGLLRSQAWALMKLYFEGEEKRILSNVVGFSKGEDLQKWAGELKMVKEMLNWPNMMLAQCDALDHAAKLREQRKEGSNEATNGSRQGYGGRRG